MGAFRKLPVTIQAFKLVGIGPMNALMLADGSEGRDGPHSDDSWIHAAIAQGYIAVSPGDPGHAKIRTLEGVMRADLGDWLIQGVKGEIYPCKPEIFTATYEAVTKEQLNG